MAKGRKPSQIENIIGKAVFENRQKILEHLNRGKENKNNHDNIEEFQRAVCGKISNSESFSSSTWSVEISSANRKEKDSIDIFGNDKEAIYIIEIDAARGDQVAKKFLSRIAIWGLNNHITYIALLYPSTQKQGKPECEKFVRFSNDILKTIKNKSKVIGIYIDCEKEIINGIERWDYKGIELWDYNMLSGFVITDKNKKSSKMVPSMRQCAKEAVKLFIKNHNLQDYDNLKKVFGRFVNNEKGKSRYSSLENLGDVRVYVYTQWREFGNQSSSWSKFVDICKKQGIIIERKVLKYDNNEENFCY